MNAQSLLTIITINTTTATTITTQNETRIKLVDTRNVKYEGGLKCSNQGHIKWDGRVFRRSRLLIHGKSLTG